MDGPSRTPPGHDDRLTVADVLQDLRPMGDLSRFTIEDLTPDEENEFFRILEEA